jgi:hypothetical protein
MNWRAWLDKPLVWVNGGIFISCWLFGAYHAWQDHTADQALMAAVLPPYGIWMAIEYELEHRGAIDWESRAQNCRENDAVRLRSGLPREQYGIWCDCTWQMVAESPVWSKRRFWLGNRRDSREFEALVKYARGSCFSSARYLAAPPMESPPVYD